MNDNFIFYRSWFEIINSNYSDDETRAKLIIAIVRYGILGDATFPVEKMFLEQCYAQIDAAKKKHDKFAEYGKKGGAPKGNKNAQKQGRVVLKQPNDNENVNANEKGNDNANDNVNISSFGNSLDGSASEEKDWKEDIE